MQRRQKHCAAQLSGKRPLVCKSFGRLGPNGSGPDPHLYGTIAITPHEAATGTRKLVNIPWGFHKRLYKVVVPAGIQEGHKLRLKGLGKQAATGERGDLFLKVLIR